MQARTDQSEVDALIDGELAVRYSLYAHAQSTSAGRESAKRKVTSFNQIMCGLPQTGGTEFPLFPPGLPPLYSVRQTADSSPVRKVLLHQMGPFEAVVAQVPSLTDHQHLRSVRRRLRPLGHCLR